MLSITAEPRIWPLLQYFAVPLTAKRICVLGGSFVCPSNLVAAEPTLATPSLSVAVRGGNKACQVVVGGRPVRSRGAKIDISAEGVRIMIYGPRFVIPPA